MARMAIRPADEPLAGARNTLFLDTITIEGVDLSAATLAMQIRLYPDTPGAPLVDLTLAVPPAQGLSVSVTTTEGLPTSVITIRINKTTMQGLPAAPPGSTEIGQDVPIAYDLVVSGGGFNEAVWFRGAFIVEGSVTR